MANLKAIKTKIGSVTNIQKITKALEIVSTVKLKKTKDKTETYKDFLSSLLHIVSLIKDKIDIFETDYHNTNKPPLYIIVSSEKGQCGSLNSKLLKLVDTTITPESEVFTIGKKAHEHAKRNNYKIIEKLHIKDNFTEHDIQPLMKFVDDVIERKIYSKITLCYNYFQNTMVQIPVLLQLLPLDKQGIDQFTQQIGIEREESKTLQNKNLELEPTSAEFTLQFKKLLIQHIIYGAVLQNKTGEFASRMIAMKNATDNSGNMIKSLKLSFNKARQASITQEISEITSAKVSMEQ